MMENKGTHDASYSFIEWGSVADEQALLILSILDLSTIFSLGLLTRAPNLTSSASILRHPSQSTHSTFRSNNNFFSPPVPTFGTTLMNLVSKSVCILDTCAKGTRKIYVAQWIPAKIDCGCAKTNEKTTKKAHTIRATSFSRCHVTSAIVAVQFIQSSTRTLGSLKHTCCIATDISNTTPTSQHLPFPRRP